MKAIINRNYTKLLTATFITRFGDSIDSIAFSWLVFVMTGSRTLMGAIFAISILPNLIVLPFGGVIADTFNKKTITVFGDILRAVSVTTLALFYFFNILEVWHLFMFVSINSLFESFANPARGSMLPSLIEQEEFVKGSSWLGTASNFGSLIGLSVASVFIAVFGIWGTILIDAFTFIFSALMITLITFNDRREEVTNKPKVKEYFVLIKEGFDYVKSKKILVILLLLAAYINFSFVPLNVLRPVYVTEVLNLGVEGLSYMGMSFLIGMIIGGYIMGIKGRNVKPLSAIGIGLSLMGLMYMLLGVPGYTSFGNTTNVLFAMIVTFLFGAFMPVVQAPMQAAIMKTTSPEMIGRLSSIMGVIALCAMPLGGAFVSLIGDSISVSMLFIVMGLSGLLLSFTFYFKNRNEVLA
jgi:DHA3 family macrolide efflux protein-like MFS transporter